MVPVHIEGVTDPDGDPVTIRIVSIEQDEPVTTPGLDTTTPDGSGLQSDTAQVRAERLNSGNGRVYKISFEATDGKPSGSSFGVVFVGAPHDQGAQHRPEESCGQRSDPRPPKLAIVSRRADSICADEGGDQEPGRATGKNCRQRAQPRRLEFSMSGESKKGHEADGEGVYGRQDPDHRCESTGAHTFIIAYSPTLANSLQTCPIRGAASIIRANRDSGNRWQTSLQNGDGRDRGISTSRDASSPYHRPYRFQTVKRWFYLKNNVYNVGVPHLLKVLLQASHRPIAGYWNPPVSGSSVC
jgi:hypothetical protein